MPGQFKRLPHTCNRRNIREGTVCKACDQVTQFPYHLTQRPPDTGTLFWDGKEWTPQLPSGFIPVGQVTTGDAQLSAALLVLRNVFGDSLSVLVRRSITGGGG
jgi:hypothetical protein